LNSYGCIRCQTRHFEDDPVYELHLRFQSKEGIDTDREKPSQLVQSDLVKDFGFPDVPKDLKIGGKKK
jgi:hypothetical protein